MRFIFAILALSIAGVVAVPVTEEEAAQQRIDQQQVNQDHPIFSSGAIKHRPDDHPPVGDDGKITGTEKIGKSTFLSPEHYRAAVGKEPNKKTDYHVVRPSDVRSAGMVPVADHGALMDNGQALKPGHVSIAVPLGEKRTPEQVQAAMKQIGDSAVRVKGDEKAEALMAKARADPTRPLSAIKAEVEAPPPKAGKQGQQGKQGKQGRQGKQGGAPGPSSEGGTGAAPTEQGPVCKRDGSFCLIGNRPKGAASKGAAGSRALKGTQTKSRTASGLRAAKGNRRVSTQAGTKAARKSVSRPGKGANATKMQRGAKTAKGVRGQKSTKGLRAPKTTKSTGVRAPKGSKATKSSKVSKSNKAVAGRKTTKGTKVTKASRTPKGTKSTRTNAVKGTKAAKGARAPKSAKGTKVAKGGRASKTTKMNKATKGKQALKGPKAAAGKKSSSTKKAGSSKRTTTKAKTTANSKAKSGAAARTGARKASTQKVTKSRAPRKQTTAARAAPVKAAAPKAKAAAAAPKKVSSPKAGKKHGKRDVIVNRPRMVYEAMEEFKRSMDGLE